FMWPYAAAIGPSEAITAARLGAVEAVRSGTTAIVGNPYSPAHPETTLGAAAPIEGGGLRGGVGRGLVGGTARGASADGLAESLFRYRAQEELDITRAAIAARPPGSRVGIWPAPINVIYNAPGLVADAIGLAHDLGTGWHTHCSEASADPGIYLQAYGIRP